MKLDHIVILVSDLKQSIPFYHTLLGLIGFQQDRDHVFGNSDGVYFDIKQASEPDHLYKRYAPGLNHIGFTAKDIAAIVSVQREMASAGFEVPEIQTIASAKALFMRDPDGMRIEITCYDP
jgi:lactoylglutathione lyase